MLHVGLDIRESKNPCGVGRYVRDLIAGLQEEHRIKLVLFHDRPKDSLPFKIMGNVDIITYTPPCSLYWEQIWLPYMLNKLKINLYHATNNVGLPWLYKGRKILTIHDVIPLIYPEVCPEKIIWLKHLITLRTDARLADCIITDSKSSKNDIKDRLYENSSKIKIIWPISFSRIHDETSCMNSFAPPQKIYNIEDRYIIHNGGMDPRKNIPRLLISFRQLLCNVERGKLQLIITGLSTTPYALKMKELSRDLGIDHAIVFTGKLSTESLQCLLKNAEFSVYPSLYEGFGLPVIEAMAAGIPVITSNVSSLPEISGGAALLIDPNNEDEIAAAMLQLYKGKDIRERLIKEGKKWITENAKKDMVKSVTELYMQCAL